MQHVFTEMLVVLQNNQNCLAAYQMVPILHPKNIDEKVS